MKLISPLLTLSLVGGLQAATVGFENITATTSMAVTTFPDSSFTVDRLVDGISDDVPAPYNGFISDSVGVISLTFSQTYNVSSFFLWNDINVVSEGISDFSLRFYNDADSQIIIPFTADYTGPVGQLAAEEYLFPSPVNGVKRVELEVLTTQARIVGGQPRTEIREVDFGVIPEPSTALMNLIGGLALLRRRK